MKKIRIILFMAIFALVILESGCGKTENAPDISDEEILVEVVGNDLETEKEPVALEETETIVESENVIESDVSDNVEIDEVDIFEEEKTKKIDTESLIDSYYTTISVCTEGEGIVNSLITDMDNNGIPEGIFLTTDIRDVETAKQLTTAGFALTTVETKNLWYICENYCICLGTSYYAFFNLDLYTLKDGTQVLITSEPGGTGWYYSNVYIVVDGKMELLFEYLPSGIVDEEGYIIYVDEIPNFLGQQRYKAELVNGELVVVEVQGGYVDDEAAAARSDG